MASRMWIATALLAVSATADAAPSLVADYQFQNVYTSSIAGAPALAPVGLNVAFSNDSIYGHSQTVFNYCNQCGLALAPTNTILPDGGSYSILIEGRHQQTGGYIKLIDYADAVSDSGLYDNNGFLDFYELATGPAVVFADDYADLALTRSSDGTMSGYVNGVLQFTADDSVGKQGVIDSSTNELFFFIDDNATGGTEASSGAVARIRIWDGPISAADVAAMSSDRIFGNGFDTILGPPI